MHWRLAGALCALQLFGSGPAAAQQFDLVINGGRVIDPESKLDAVRSVGIRAGKVVAVSATPLSGKTVIDAKGQVVAPGSSTSTPMARTTRTTASSPRTG